MRNKFFLTVTVSAFCLFLVLSDPIHAASQPSAGGIVTAVQDGSSLNETPGSHGSTPQRTAGYESAAPSGKQTCMARMDRLSTRAITRGTTFIIRRLTNTANLAIIVFFLPIGLCLGLAGFGSFTALCAIRQKKHLDDIVQLEEAHPWKTLFLGLVAFLLSILALIIFIRLGRPFLLLLYLGWLVRLVLQCLAAMAVSTAKLVAPGSDEMDCKVNFKGSAVLFSIFFIPFYGQLVLLGALLRGMGAKVWLFYHRHTGTVEKVRESMARLEEERSGNDPGSQEADAAGHTKTDIENGSE